jgi:hypothetical protein
MLAAFGMFHFLFDELAGLGGRRLTLTAISLGALFGSAFGHFLSLQFLISAAVSGVFANRLLGRGGIEHSIRPRIIDVIGLRRIDVHPSGFLSKSIKRYSARRTNRAGSVRRQAASPLRGPA